MIDGPICQVNQPAALRAEETEELHAGRHLGLLKGCRERLLRGMEEIRIRKVEVRSASRG